MKPRVLMIAYACNPEGSGEHWLGWGWAEQAAKNFSVDLITTTNASAAVEKNARTLGITPHFVGTPTWWRKLTDLAEQAAKNFSVDLITTTNASAAVEKNARTLGITPHFVGTPTWWRKLTDLTGTSWLRKLSWQRRTFGLAKTLHARQQFDVVHQTTFHTFRVPFLAAGLGIPSVWGPIAGGERVPSGFEGYLGPAR